MRTTKARNVRTLAAGKRRGESGGIYECPCPNHIQPYNHNNTSSRPTLAITTGYNDTLIFRCTAGCTVRAILTALRDNYGIIFPYPLAEFAFQEHAETVMPALNHLLRIAAHILMDDAYLALHTPTPPSPEKGTEKGPEKDTAGEDLAAANRLVQAQPAPIEDPMAPFLAKMLAPAPSESLFFANTDLGNSQRLYRLVKNRVLYVPEVDQWYLWQGAYWQEDKRFTLMALAKLALIKSHEELEHDSAQQPSGQQNILQQKGLQQSQASKARHRFHNGSQLSTARRLDAMINLLRSEPSITVSYERLDQQHGYLPCRNGTIDLHTGQLEAANPTHLFTRCLDLDYDPDALCPLWLAFLQRIMGGDSELIGYLQRLIGHALSGDAGGKYFVFLWGPGGNNGKSTLVEIILRLLGPFALKSPTTMLTAKAGRNTPTNDIARLRGIRFTVTNEVDEEMTLSDTLIKDLTGRDTLTARYPHREYFEFAPTHKLWIYGNQRPQIRNADPALWQRVQLIPFEVTIPPGERDPHLLDKLTLELPGILAWAVAGCLEWQRLGIQPPPSVQNAADAYRLDQDTIAHFIDDCFIIDPTARISCADLYATYLTWCKESATQPYNPNKFAAAMERLGFPKSATPPPAIAPASDPTNNPAPSPLPATPAKPIHTPNVGCPLGAQESRFSLPTLTPISTP